MTTTDARRDVNKEKRAGDEMMTMEGWGDEGM